MAAGALICLLSVSCASIFFNYKPVWMVDGPRLDDGQVSLICGQAYMESYGNWIQAHIKAVDGKEVFVASERPTTLVYLLPGKHTLTILGAMGNSMHGYVHKEPPVVEADLQPGQAYQLLFDIVRADGQPNDSKYGAKYRLVHIGSIKQFKAFQAKHPEREAGTPFPVLPSID